MNKIKLYVKLRQIKSFKNVETTNKVYEPIKIHQRHNVVKTKVFETIPSLLLLLL